MDDKNMALCPSPGTGKTLWIMAWIPCRCSRNRGCLQSCVACGLTGKALCQRHSRSPFDADGWPPPWQVTPYCHQRAAVQEPPSRGLSPSRIYAGIGSLEPIHWRASQNFASSLRVCWWLHTLPLLFSPGQPASSCWRQSAIASNKEVGRVLPSELCLWEDTGHGGVSVSGSLTSCWGKGEAWLRHSPTPGPRLSPAST